MRRRDLVIAGFAVALAAGRLAWGEVGAASAERGRRGKVVRVERPKAIATDEVQLCGIDTTSGDPDKPRLMCFGAAPRLGATIEFVDEAGYRGSGRVLRTEAGLSVFDRCEEKSGHTVYFEWTSGDGAQSGTYGANLAGVIGVKVNRRSSRLLSSPDRRPPQGETSAVAIGLDADGDSSADLVVLWRECRNTVPARSSSAGAQQGAVICLDYWLYSHANWTRVNQAVIYSCF